MLFTSELVGNEAHNDTWLKTGVWRIIQAADVNQDAVSYIVKLLPREDVEATIYELLASHSVSTHTLSTEVVRDPRGNFLLMPDLLKPFLLRRVWTLGEIFGFYVQVLEVRSLLLRLLCMGSHGPVKGVVELALGAWIVRGWTDGLVDAGQAGSGCGVPDRPCVVAGARDVLALCAVPACKLLVKHKGC